MRIPACLSRDILSLHGAIARNHILDNAGLDVADVRSAVCGRRSVVEHIGLAALALLDGLLKDAVFCPELFDFALARHKVHIRGDFSVHFFLLLSQKESARPSQDERSLLSLYHLYFAFPRDVGITAERTRRQPSAPNRGSKVIFDASTWHRASTVPDSLWLFQAPTLFVIAFVLIFHKYNQTVFLCQGRNGI